MAFRILMSIQFLLFATPVLRAQAYYFRHYQVEQGLSNNTVFCSAQDKRGFFWMGTKDGLNRFDGYTFKIFRNDPKDPGSLGDNFVRSLFIDDRDTLYAGTRNGLYRYNAMKENFTSLYHSPDEVKDIKKDRDGKLWFITGQVLIQLDERTGTIKKFSQDLYFAATSVCIDSSGVVWVSTADGYLQKYKKATSRFQPYDLFPGNRSTSPRWIEKVVATKRSLLMVGTSNYGVKAFDILSGKFEDILTYNEDRTGIFARDFVQTGENEWWFATESGIFIYNTRDRTFTNLKNQYGNPYSITDNAVYTLCRDQQGGIWAGTYFGGINYYPKQYTTFQKYFSGINHESISGNAVREICEDHYGNLWIGTEDDGLNRLNRSTGQFTQFHPTGTPSGISYSNIHGLLARGNELWVGTFEHGLDILDINSGKVVRHYPRKDRDDALKSNFIVVIYQTRNDEIYIGTRQGLYRFDFKSDSFVPVNEVPEHCFIHSITEDHNGTLWIGTLGSGLYLVNPVKEAVSHFSHQPGKDDGLNSNSVTTVFEATDGTMWIGTEGGGLCKFNAADSTFQAYTAANGFPANTVFRVLEDKSRLLWITTSNGLLAFNPHTNSINVYTIANGLLSNQFNYNSGYQDTSGQIFVGSVKGMVSFKPSSFTRNTFIPPIYITGLYINDKELQPGDKHSPLQQAISMTKKVVLNHDQSSFSIDFAALSFSAPEMTEYKYITEGLDNDWTYIKTNRKVYFTNLSPGTYTFRVKAANNGGTWTDDGAYIIIKILPPLWASPLAYSAYGLLALAGIFFLVRGYHKRVKEKTSRKIEFLEHEKEKEIYEAKINFFTNVAHEIKTPLTLIRAPMEQIAKRTNQDPDLDYDLKIMQRNTDKLIELTNQLLDFRAIETSGFKLNLVSTNINELLAERYGSFKPLADQRNIRLDLSLPDSPVHAYVDLDALQKILNNLLYNAINYGSRFVEVELMAPVLGDQYYTIEVRNDGLLIPVHLKEKIFEPFYRMKENRNKAGSGIGLALSRSLAVLHHGTIMLNENDRNLNIFVLRLPLQPLVTEK